MGNEEKAKMIADQCRPCSEDFYSGIKQGVILALKASEKDTDIAYLEGMISAFEQSKNHDLEYYYKEELAKLKS